MQSDPTRALTIAEARNAGVSRADYRVVYDPTSPSSAPYLIRHATNPRAWRATTRRTVSADTAILATEVALGCYA